MQKLLVFLVVAIFAVNLHAQDTLFKTNGQRQVVTILDIMQTQIKYRPYLTQDAPVFIIQNRYVSKIVFKNGETKTFTAKATTPDSTNNIPFPKQENNTNSRHFISLNAADLLMGMFTIDYEYTLGSGKLGLKFPLSTGYGIFNQTNVDYGYGRYVPRSTIIGSGISLNFYPAGLSQVAYFVGPSFQYRKFRADYNFFDPVNYTTTYIKRNGTFISLFIQNGLLFQAGPKLNLNLNIGLGYAHITETENPDNAFRMNLGANIGYRF